MNTNRIETKRFSNPDTQRLFRESWTEERIAQERAEQQSCGYCFHNWALGDQTERQWMLCLNPKSKQHHETVDASFSCPHQEHGAVPTRDCTTADEV